MNARSRTLPLPHTWVPEWMETLLVVTAVIALSVLSAGSLDKGVNAMLVGFVTACPTFMLCCATICRGKNYRATCIRTRVVGITIFCLYLGLVAVICR